MDCNGLGFAGRSLFAFARIGTARAVIVAGYGIPRFAGGL